MSNLKFPLTYLFCDSPNLTVLILPHRHGDDAVQHPLHITLLLPPVGICHEQHCGRYLRSDGENLSKTPVRSFRRCHQWDSQHIPFYARYFDASHEAVFRQRDVGGSGRLHQVCDGDYENHCWCTGYHFISKVLDQTLPRLGRRIEGIQTGFTAYSGNILYEAKSPAQKVFSPYDRF